AMTITVTVKKEADKKEADKKKDAKDKKDDKDKKLDQKDNDQNEAWVYRFGKEGTVDKTDGIYALVNKVNLVFLTQSVSVKALREAELRDRTVFSFDAAKVKQVTMKGWVEKAKNQFTLTLLHKDADSWKVAQPPNFELSDRAASSFVRELA